MRVLVDMDGVLADWERSLLERYRAAHPGKPFVPLAERSTFYAIEQYPEELRPLVREIFLAPGFYRGLAPIEGARQALAALLEAGHDVAICSAPLSEYRNCVLEKYEWVEEHLGSEWTRVLMLTKDKTRVRGDLLIDDKPEVTGAFAPSWEHVLYDQPYNRAVAGKRRLTWATWREVLG